MEARHAPWRTPPRQMSSRFLVTSPASSPASSPRNHHRSSSSSFSSTNTSTSTSTSTLSRSLWPSSKKQPTTLADHLDKDRNSLFSDRNNSAPPPEPLFRHKSCSNYNSQFETDNHDKNEKKIARSASKGGSTRYISNKIPSYRSSSPPRDVTLTPGRIISNPHHNITLTPGRIIDNAVRRDYASSESERRETANVSTARSVKSSALMRARSVGQATTMQWAPSPGLRPPSPPAVNATAAAGKVLSSLRPPSPAKGRKVGSLISLGLDHLFKRKSSSAHVAGEAGYQLRMMNNRLIQWRFINAKSDAVNQVKLASAQAQLLSAWARISELQRREAHKRVQLHKEKLHLKLRSILSSQMKVLEGWGAMERQHASALSTTSDRLQAAVSKVPLTDGATADLKPLSSTLRQAMDHNGTIQTAMNGFIQTVSNILAQLRSCLFCSTRCQEAQIHVLSDQLTLDGFLTHILT
uniref:QWRF motif-containing protein 3 n=1 Tax=Ananas comosus var. bracteatus TaxID=296719 RepID=A0A6V7QEF2_ANACO|nr:unnamed protein product [Ananas comosus var. bracteatus]